MEHRPTWAEINLGTLRANVASMITQVAPSDVLVVVKANAYGHGAVPVARAVLDAGAAWLAVALVEEAQVLRAAGIRAPILLLSEPPPSAVMAMIGAQVTPVVYSLATVEAIAKAVAEYDASRPYPVHLEVDTGMHRVGCAPDHAVVIANAIAAGSELTLAGLCTHLATADTPGDPRIAEQLQRFDAVRSALHAAGHDPGLVHVANTAAALTLPGARANFVRTGIGIYGVNPVPLIDVAVEPVFSLRSEVAYVHDVPEGTPVSYGNFYRTSTSSRIATVPIGYADGVPRALGLRGGTVLIRNARFPIVGVVTMDQLMVDCGDVPVAAGDEVVLIGQQGDEIVSASDWATCMETIPYEILCGISDRVPRRYRD